MRTLLVIFMHNLPYFINYSARPKAHDTANANGASHSEKEITSTDEVFKGLIEWLSAQVYALSTCLMEFHI